MQFGTPHPSSLEGILRELNYWEQCICCVDFGDSRCHPLGNQELVYDTSQSQVVIKKGATTAAPTSTNMANIDTFKRHLLSDITTPTYMDFDGSNDYMASDLLPWIPSIMIEGCGSAGDAVVRFSYMGIVFHPSSGAVHQAVCAGYNDISFARLIKGNTDNINASGAFASTMTDWSVPVAMNVGADWNFCFCSINSADATDGESNMVQNTVATEAGVFVSPAIWTGIAPITLGCARPSTLSNSTFWNGGILMFAYFAEWAPEVGDIRLLKQVIRERRITDMA